MYIYIFVQIKVQIVFNQSKLCMHESLSLSLYAAHLIKSLIIKAKNKAQ